VANHGGEHPRMKAVPMPHTLLIRVYYEDTDMAGIVYYANYLRYIERARSDWVRGLGIDQNAMKAQGLVFAVRRVEADYLMPARLDDELVVETEVLQVTGARLVMDQVVSRGKDRLFHAIVTVVVITEGGLPARMPANIRQMLH
jgi:acyl-CoA thioester hydrolase